MQTKPGKKQDALKAMMREDRTIAGAINFYVYHTGTDELWGAAVFDDEKTYRANANDPQQDNWYRQLREFLVAEPEWHDGTIISWPNNRN